MLKIHPCPNGGLDQGHGCGLGKINNTVKNSSIIGFVVDFVVDFDKKGRSLHNDDVIYR